MSNRIKILLSTLILSVAVFGRGFSIKADNKYASGLVDQALKEKTFYHYNVAYSEAMKLTNETEKAELLNKLSSIADIVWDEDMKRVYRVLLDMVDTAGGRIYDNIQVQIANADIPGVDKEYLLGEVTSWGTKLVWTEEYKKTFAAIMNAWTNTNAGSIAGVETALAEMKNNYSRGYLSEELAKIKSKYNDTLYVIENKNGNINNYGFIAKVGDLIYFSDLSKGGKLSKAKADGSSVTKINDDEAMFINVYDNWIYYVNYSDGGTIYKISTDGKNRIKISEDKVAYLNVSDGVIYYQKGEDNLSLYKMDTKGGNVQKLSEDIPGYVNVVGEYIYYSNLSGNGEIIRINAEGKGRTVINNNMSLFLNVAGDWIYYVNNQDRSTYKVNVDGKNRTKVSSISTLALNISEDWIYYVNETDKYSLYRLSLNGAKNEKLTDYAVGAVNAFAGKIYFFDGETGTSIYSMNKDKTGLKKLLSY